MTILKAVVIVCMAVVASLDGASLACAQSIHPTATVTFNGSASASSSGSITLVVNGHTQSVAYGPLSTSTSVASAFAAAFSSYPAAAWPRLCTNGVCAKANSSSVIFQLTAGQSFGPITITNNPTTGSNPFGAVVSIPSNISLSSNPSPASIGQAVTVVATVPQGATGNVEFYLNGKHIASGPISGTFSTVLLAAVPVGSNTVSAVYLGDANYSGSVNDLTEIVNQAAPNVTLSTSGTPIPVGAAVTFSATVSGGSSVSPTGVVTFEDGNTMLGSAQISASACSLTTSSLAAGTHNITASYSGDQNYKAASSSVVTEVVANPGGVITTVAGNGNPGYSGDGGAAKNAQLDKPLGVAVDPKGNIYIADWAYSRIRRVDATTGLISTIAGNGQSYSGDGSGTNTGIGLPDGLALDSSGNLYIADGLDSRVLKWTASNGMITNVAGNGTAGFGGDGGSATSAYLDGPTGVTVDAGGNLYIVEGGDCELRKVNTAGIITKVAGTASCGYSGDGGSANSAQLYPYQAYIDSLSNIYVADYGNNRVRKIDSAGNVSTIAGNGTAGYSGDGGPATSAELNSPTSVYMDAAGNLFIVDNGDNRVRKINTAGIITTVAGNGVAGFSGDGGSATAAEVNFLPNYFASLAVDRNGALYITDTGNNRVRAVSPVSNALSVDLGTSGSPATYGTSVIFTATVPAGDTNSVVFNDGSNLLGSVMPNNGTASITVANLPVGTNPITATIAAGGGYPASTSDTIDQIITSLNSTISVTNVPSFAGYGGAFTAQYAYQGDGTTTVTTSTPAVCGASDSNVYFISSGTCTVQAHASATQDYAAANGSPQSFVVSPPTITALAPSSGPESSQITISGVGFGLSPTSTSVSFNGTPAFISHWSNSAITAIVPTGATTGNVIVMTNGISSNGLPFTVQATTPTISAISPSAGAAGLAVTVSGSGFGAAKGQSTVTFNGVAAAVLNWNDTSITALVPTGATSGPVIVALPNGQTSNATVTFAVTGGACEL